MLASELLAKIAFEGSKALTQIVTGRLLTDEQINSVTQNTVGAFFRDWFPISEEEVELKERVEEARLHIVEAGQIMADLQIELDEKTRQLDHISREVKERRRIATHYKTITGLRQEEFAAIKTEIEKSLRKELQAEAKKGRRIRQTLAAVMWFVTLIAGTALGEYFSEIIRWLRSLVGI